jgi:hypothetical protein
VSEREYSRQAGEGFALGICKNDSNLALDLDHAKVVEYSSGSFHGAQELRPAHLLTGFYGIKLLEVSMQALRQGCLAQ